MNRQHNHHGARESGTGGQSLGIVNFITESVGRKQAVSCPSPRRIDSGIGAGTGSRHPGFKYGP